MEHIKKKILIADDDPSIVDALTLMLEDEGYDIEATGDGQMVKDLEKGHPDLILLDIWMSGWHGRDICIYLKGQESTRHIPIIIISANKDTKEIALQAGADDFITKPFEMDALIEKVARYTL